MDLFELSESLSARAESVGFEALTPAEQTFITIWSLEADVNNGGFDQYYFNSSGDHARFAPAALRAIGAREAAAIVEEANAIFGPDGPPRDRDQRQDALEALGEDRSSIFSSVDERFFEYPDDLQTLLTDYVQSHEAELRS